MRPAQVVDSLEALEAVAASFALSLLPKESGATLVTLSGDLGAGKTTFTQAVARALGVMDRVTSPTFVLQKSYNLENTAFKKLVHIDAYRLESGKDLVPLTFADTLADASTLVMLEWPEMVVNGLPPVDVAVTLVAEEDNSRSISYA